jgi:hypothetical protein
MHVELPKSNFPVFKVIIKIGCSIESEFDFLVGEGSVAMSLY